MRRRDVTWSFVICTSVAAHVAVIGGAAERYARNAGGRVYLPAPATRGDTIQVRRGEFGERGASGYAVNASDGDEALRARKGDQDQALLSRDPAGPGHVGDEPSESLIPPGGGAGSSAAHDVDGAPAAPPPQLPPRIVAVLPAAAPEAQASIGIGPKHDDLRLPATRPSRVLIAVADPDLSAEADRPAAPAPSAGAPKDAAEAADVANPADAPAGGARAAADPAPMSESESDAFSTLGGIEFRGGKMEARLGRRFKSVRPRLDIAAQYDLLGLSFPRMVLKVVTDDTGKVTKVEVLKSTGSRLVDQPMTVAMYQWWFEPPLDANGKPKGDVIVFPIAWR